MSGLLTNCASYYWWNFRFVFSPCFTFSWKKHHQPHILSATYYHTSNNRKKEMAQKLPLYNEDRTDFAPPQNKNYFCISVEGNIGSGKSTLLNSFEENGLVEAICEPVDLWTNVKGHNALGLLYTDPTRWSFSFNMFAMLTRVNMHTRPCVKPVKMLERSLYSARYCFIENSGLDGTLKTFEKAILDQWFNYLVADHKADLDLIVYLKADPEVCYERLKKRSRKEEAGLPMEFLQSLHRVHEDWLIHKNYPTPAPVIVIDANRDLPTMKEVFNQTQKDIFCNYSIPSTIFH